MQGQDEAELEQWDQVRQHVSDNQTSDQGDDSVAGDISGDGTGKNGKKSKR